MEKLILITTLTVLTSFACHSGNKKNKAAETVYLVFFSFFYCLTSFVLVFIVRIDIYNCYVLSWLECITLSSWLIPIYIFAYYVFPSYLKKEITALLLFIFSHEPRLYKRVCPSVGPSIGRKCVFSVGSDKTANNLFCVYELVYFLFFTQIEIMLLQGIWVSYEEQCQ